MLGGEISLGELAAELGVRPATIGRWREDALRRLRHILLPQRRDGEGGGEGLQRAMHGEEEWVRLRELNAVLLQLLRAKGVTARDIAALDGIPPRNRLTMVELCRALGVSRSSYYAACRRRAFQRGNDAAGPPESPWVGDDELLAAMRRLVRRDPKMGGRPMQAALAAAGLPVSRRRVWRLLRQLRRERTPSR